MLVKHAVLSGATNTEAACVEKTTGGFKKPATEIEATLAENYKQHP